MKKTIGMIALALVLAIFGLPLIACGSSDPESPNTPAALLVSIEVTSPPDRYEYDLNATALDITGLVVTAIYKNDEERVIANTALELSPRLLHVW